MASPIVIGEPALPPPVRRYFERVIPHGQRRIRGAVVAQEGTFLLRPPRVWRPFRAIQAFTTRPPGFLWDATIRLCPGIKIAVRDAFHEGAGSMHARLLRFVRLVETAGTPEIASAALQRYLAEAGLFPTALLPGEGVAWTPIDDGSARAHLTVDGTSVSLAFRFGGDGLVAGIFAPDRMRNVGGRAVPTPWRGRWWDYEEQDGVLAPRSGEVGWLLREGPQTYWRGRVTSIAYELD